MGRSSPSTHPVQAPLQEVQEDADRIHVDAHVLQRARPHFGSQEHIQTLEGQVAQQVDCVAARVKEKRSEHTVMELCSQKFFSSAEMKAGH